MQSSILDGGKKIKKLINEHQTLFSILLVFGIGFIFSAWLLKDGIINGHDMTFHLSRIKGLRDSILNGDYLALIHDGLYGYGYANGLFYGNLLMYLPAIVAACGANLITSYKVYVAFCTVMSALTMFFCIKRITKNNGAGLLAAFLYSACSYKICDFIIRAAAGEIAAFIFLPIILLGLYELLYGNYKKWYIFSIGFVGLIQCHLISTVLAFVIVAAIFAFHIWKLWDDKKRIFYIGLSGVIGLLIGAYFIFPLLEALFRNNLVVNLNSFPIWDRTIPFVRLFLGLNYYESDLFMPAGIGILFFILMAFRFKIKKDKNDKVLKFCDLSIVAGIVTLLLATDLFPWKELTFLQSVQFPWRLYLFSSIFFTIASSIIVMYYLKDKTRKQKIRFIIPVLLVALIPYITTEKYFRANSTGGIFYDWDSYTVASGEYLPIDTDLELLEERGEVVTSNNESLVITFSKTGNDILLEYSNNTEEGTYIEVPLIYYYGYTAISEIYNYNYQLSLGENNIIRIYLTEASDSIHIYYKGTIIQKASYVISIITCGGLAVYLVYQKKNRVKINEKNKGNI